MSAPERRKTPKTPSPRPSPFARRRSGVLLHPTSLPGGHGIGDLGPAAHEFAEFLARAGQTYWQMLPICPQGAGYSPYDSPSACAISPLLLSLDALADTGLLARHEFATEAPLPSIRRADMQSAETLKRRLLELACSRLATAPTAIREAFESFVERESDWLDAHALFFALKEQQGGRPWVEFEPGLRDRKPGAIAKAERELADAIHLHKFIQFELDRQWTALLEHCRGLGLTLMGDVPIYVAHDSADVWANRQVFHLDRQGKRKVVAGVPPDYFSATGQLWGNPLYRWSYLKTTGFAWWKRRFRITLRRFDTVRLDHFIGFRHYWEVPGDALTAETGRYMPVPGEAFFAALTAEFGGLPFLAEDLGVVTAEIHALREGAGLPGMRILQFAFDDAKGSDYLPHRYDRDTAVYTGTHDNDTTMGWLWAPLPDDPSARAAQLATRERAKAYLASDGTELHWDMARAALMSVANTAIIPAQDLLGLGSDSRMNTPGTVENNWVFRLFPGEMSEATGARLRDLCAKFERLPTPD